MNILLNCPGLEIGAILQVAKNIISLIQIIVPIVLIASLVIKFIHLAQKPDDKKLPKQIQNSLLAAAIVFLIPFLVGVAINIYRFKFL